MSSRIASSSTKREAQVVFSTSDDRAVDVFEVRASAAECEAWAERLRRRPSTVPASVREAQRAARPGSWTIESLLRDTRFGDEMSGVIAGRRR